MECYIIGVQVFTCGEIRCPGRIQAPPTDIINMGVGR
jgi:hypothetical protein